MENHEHQAKYQKLATEYSKVRAQNQVLKKAVIEEQQRSCKQNELVQSLRRADQENDSLNFRNQQLTCRLALLQDDLQQLQGSKSNRKVNSNNSSVDDSASIKSGTGSNEGLDVEVLVQELQAKISENASLHARVSDLEQGSFEREALEEKLEQLEGLQHQNRDLTKQLQDALDALELHERTTKGKIEQLNSDTVTSAVTIQQQSKHIAKLKQQLLQLKQDGVVVKISPPLTPLHVGSPSLASPSSVSSSSSYVSLAQFSSANDIAHNARSVTNCTLPSSQCLPKTEQTAAFRLDLPHKSTEASPEILATPFVPIPTLSRDLCLKFASFIRAYCEVKKSHLCKCSPNDSVEVKALETITKVLQGLTYWEKLAPLLESVMARTIGSGLSGGTTNNTTTGTDSAIVGNVSTTTASTLAHLRIVSSIPSSAAFQSSLRSIQSCWSAILPYLSALSANSNRSHSQTTMVRLVGLLADRCAGLHNALEDAHSKWLLQEKDEQDETVSQELKDLARVTQKLAHILKSNLDTGLVKETYDSSYSKSLVCSSGGLSAEQMTSTHLLDLDATNQQSGGPSSPPSPSSLSSPDESSASTSSSSNVLEANAARLSQLHRQREHWRLEYHLLSHKYTKLMKVLKDRKPAEDESSEAVGNKVIQTSLLGEVVYPTSTTTAQSTSGKQLTKNPESSSDTTDEYWRESMIRHHLNGRCSKLFLELTAMSSKAMVLQDEADAATKRLEESEDVRINIENDLDSVREERVRLAEELKTTCSNYEVQISTMSEHLVCVNEKIAYHEDQAATRKLLGRKGRK